KTVRRWDVRSAFDLKTAAGAWVVSLAFSRGGDGKTILTAGYRGGDAEQWDVATRKKRPTPQATRGHSLSVVALTPDGQTLAVVGPHQGRKTVQLWDVATGRKHDAEFKHSHEIFRLAFSPDGSTLAVADTNNAVTLWRVGTGDCFRWLKGHTKLVNVLAFAPDGTVLASGGSTLAGTELVSEIRLWEVKTGRPLLVLGGQQGAITALAFAPDGKTLASAADSENTVRLWRL